MRWFADFNKVYEFAEKQAKEADQMRQRLVDLRNKYEGRGRENVSVRARIETEVRNEGGITYIRERIARHTGESYAYDNMARALTEVTEPAE